MEIIMSESDKRIIKWGVMLLRKKLGESASKEKIHDDMQNCGNIGVKIICDIINEEANKVKCDHQKNIANDLSELGMWICYKDTAYRDLFFSILDKICANADEIRKQIKPYVKPPEKWHVNVWMDSREQTAEKIAKGEIPQGSVSLAESVHVPSIQKKRLAELNKK